MFAVSIFVASPFPPIVLRRRKSQRRSIARASGSSPLKGTKPPKSPQSPVVTGNTSQVVTATKQAKSSNSSGDNSSKGTGNENASPDNSSNNSTGIGNASATMTTQFDAKLEHVLIHYLSATGVDRHIQKHSFMSKSSLFKNSLIAVPLKVSRHFNEMMVIIILFKHFQVQN